LGIYALSFLLSTYIKTFIIRELTLRLLLVRYMHPTPYRD